MAMITGLPRSSIRFSKGFKLSRQIIFPEVSSPNSLMSAPATKVRPAPINTTPLTLSSFSICETTAAIPAETAELSAFTGGLLMVTTAIPFVFVSCTRSLMNSASTSISMAPCVRISGERNAGFLGNGAELFDYRHNQRNAFLAAQFFRAALGITGDERTGRPGRGLGGAKDADEIVHLPLELVGVD